MPPRELDLDAYLKRIGLEAAGPPSLETLSAIVARHTTTIPFENLDIVLGRPIRLDISSIQAKLVEVQRGGYCFEQNTLLQAVLQQMGFTVRSLMARVVRGAPADAITPRTHMLLRVDLPQGAFLADVGFGNLTPTVPLLLDSHEPQPSAHEDFRLQAMHDETLLQVRIGTEWQQVYRFSGVASHAIDHEVGNWFTSTKPDGLFTANVIAARPGTKCRKTLFNGVVTIRDVDDQTRRWLVNTEPALRNTLHDDFGIELDDAELAHVRVALDRFAARPDAGFRLD